jgi:uncharacterized protein (DUF2147 family)
MRTLILAGAAAAALLAGAAGAVAAEPTGVWLSQSGDTKVRIARCGAELCGTIVWAKSGGKDAKNPDPALRDRPLVGLRMMYGMRASGETYSGKLYNYTDGKTYNGHLKLLAGDRLDLSGCVMGVFCKHQTWTRSS